MDSEQFKAFIQAVGVPPLRPEHLPHASHLGAAMTLLGIHQPDPHHPTGRKELAVRLARYAFAVWRQNNS